MEKAFEKLLLVPVDCDDPSVCPCYEIDMTDGDHIATPDQPHKFLIPFHGDMLSALRFKGGTTFEISAYGSLSLMSREIKDDESYSVELPLIAFQRNHYKNIYLYVYGNPTSVIASYRLLPTELRKRFFLNSSLLYWRDFVIDEDGLILKS